MLRMPLGHERVANDSFFIIGMQVNTCIERRENGLFYGNCTEKQRKGL